MPEGAGPTLVGMTGTVSFVGEQAVGFFLLPHALQVVVDRLVHHWLCSWKQVPRHGMRNSYDLRGISDSARPQCKGREDVRLFGVHAAAAHDEAWCRWR